MAPARPDDDLVEAGRQLLARDRADLALALVRDALAHRTDLQTLRAACRIAYDAARLDEALAWADALERAAPAPGAGEQRLIGAIRDRAAVRDRLIHAAHRTSTGPVVAGRVFSLLAYSLPYSTTGYATRSHGLLSAVQARGWDVMPLTRPGYPQDADPALAGRRLPAEDAIGPLVYRRLFEPSRRALGHMPYLLAAADEIGRQLRAHRPSVVHAASNYITALPAFVAAREHGLPFVYEVRGFWDITRASSDPAFARGTEHRYLRLFESALLARADAVITLTDAMRAELVLRGAAADRIHVARNAVDAQRFVPQPRDAGLAARLGLPDGVPVIGYIGSFVDYEGLDDLVDACARLRQAGCRFHLLLVGDGLARAAVAQRIADAGLAPWATLAGQVPHDEVARHYGLVDICAFPRKPWPVCELVSPLKPYEAMAFAKPVVVSDVAAMAEMVDDGVTGRLFAKGDVEALARVLAEMLGSPERAALGQRARAWVADQRSWRRSAEAVEAAYRQALGAQGA